MNANFLTQIGDTYEGFRLEHLKNITELQCTLRELVHIPSGAQVLHLANDDVENVFTLSFRTTPTSSNGVAHILEHTVLCGSEKYPIKDPFFAMIRRSLNTFMNAMTGADFTCYPAASQVPKDFYNLLEVYLDAVFKPKLALLSFRQEGHRLEFVNPSDPSTPLQYKGIVYNEMKGGMASPASRLDEVISAALFPDLTYGVNSGGNPKAIPSLTYEEFLDFHKAYYHPGRCLFYFYGNLPLKGHLDFLLKNTLSNTEKIPPLSPIPLQKRYQAPVRCASSYPAGPDEDAGDKAYIAIGWLTCHILNVDEVLALQIIDSALMDTDASPLKLALLKSGLCKQASLAMEDEINEVPWILTLRGCDATNADAVEKLVLSELKRIADEGIPCNLVESAMHQMELSRSEITGDSSPFGLSLFWRSALLKQHGGKPENGLVIHALFDRLRALLKQNPRYLSELIEKHLIHNPHRVTVVMTPDTNLTKAEEAAEAASLERIKESLTEQQKRQLVADAQELQAFQRTQEEQDTTCLPRVTLADVPREARDFPLIREKVGNLETFRHCCFTNGLVYADLYFDLPFVANDELPYVRLFGNLASQVGSGGRDYRSTLEYMHEHTGGVSASLSLHPRIDGADDFQPTLSLRGRSLYRKGERLFPAMLDMVTSLDFSDRDRIEELLRKHYTGLESSFHSQSMRYALNLAASGLDKASYVHYSWYGIGYYQFVRDLVRDLKARLPDLIDKLIELRGRLLDLESPHLVVACDENYFRKIADAGFYGLDSIGNQQAAPWRADYPLHHLQPRGCIISSPVAFTGKTFSVPSYLHPDAPALSLAGNILENTILHQRIREEGGAYGSGAGNNTTYGHFFFYSYRDPNISQTLSTFNEAVEALAQGDFSDEDLEEAKLEKIQEADSPVSPGSRASIAYGWYRAQKTLARRQAFRDKLLGTTWDEVKAAAAKHLLPKIQQTPAVVFAGKELLEKENALLVQAGSPELEITLV